MLKHLQISFLILFVYTTGNLLSAAELVSGYHFLKPETQAMQDDEFANPGMSAVEKGRKLFHEKGVNGKTCATCHGRNGSKFDSGRIARYPVYNEEWKKPFTLQEQINVCWTNQLDNVPFVYDCVSVVALEAFVRYQARGEKVNVDVSGKLKPYFEAGKKLYYTRFGQADMSCAHCHEKHQGQQLRGQTLNQGHSNGFPEYRLATGKITSLHRRFKECFRSFRAEPFEAGSKEFINLEIYVHHRGNGLPIETPAVRY